MEVENKIKTYKINGKSTVVGQKDAHLIVRNVWNSNRLVELEFGGNKIEVRYDELKKAMDNSTGNEIY